MSGQKCPEQCLAQGKFPINITISVGVNVTHAVTSCALRNPSARSLYAIRMAAGGQEQNNSRDHIPDTVGSEQPWEGLASWGAGGHLGGLPKASSHTEGG